MASSLLLSSAAKLHCSTANAKTPTPIANGSPSPAIMAASQSQQPRRPEYVPNRIDDPNYVRIFDTTLRDGEQAPGATMTSAEKLVVARQLARLGVDIIEAGFPAASPDDLDAVRSIAMEVGNSPVGGDGEGGHVPVICGFSRCNRRDIDAAWEAVRHARRPRILTFIATSEIHMQHKLRKTPEQVVAIAREMVAYARSLGCPDVEFGAEDAGRSNKEFLYHILGEVIKAGATTITIPDTVGYNLPCEFGKLIADIKANTPGIENAIISTHCHNDLGLATANTLAGARAGARQLEVTINGIGERAGNASLEEVVMAIKCRQKLLDGLYTGINSQHITITSKMVQEHSGLQVQPHKAIVGTNAFAHGSGIHQDGMLKYKGTYQIISPDDIGLTRSNEFGIVLGKLSGRHALRSKLMELGYEISDKEFEDFFKRYKEVAEKKKRVTDEDIEALLSDVVPTNGCAVGTGPVDAAYKAVDQIIQIPTVLRENGRTSVTEGIDAIATTGDVTNNSKHAFTGQRTNTLTQGSIPKIDFAGIDPAAEAGGGGGGEARWAAVRSAVMDALRTHGCFEAVTDGLLSPELHAAVLGPGGALETLHSLPASAKERNNTNHMPSRGYIGSLPGVAAYESSVIMEPHSLDSVRAFADLLWPDTGNAAFCEWIHAYVEKVDVLVSVVRRMVLESVGATAEYIENLAKATSFKLRLAAYEPPGTAGGRLGLYAHRDTSYLTVLTQNDIDGIELEDGRGDGDGGWTLPALSPGSFLVMAGEMLRVLTNDRVYSPLHRVVVAGDKTRYSAILFAAPRDDFVVETVDKAVDADHPAIFKPFKYGDYYLFVYKTQKENNNKRLHNNLDVFMLRRSD